MFSSVSQQWGKGVANKNSTMGQQQQRILLKIISVNCCENVVLPSPRWPALSPCCVWICEWPHLTWTSHLSTQIRKWRIETLSILECSSCIFLIFCLEWLNFKGVLNSKEWLICCKSLELFLRLILWKQTENYLLFVGPHSKDTCLLSWETKSTSSNKTESGIGEMLNPKPWCCSCVILWSCMLHLCATETGRSGACFCYRHTAS